MNTEPDQHEIKDLYIPQLEKDSCGVGMLVDLKGVQSHEVVDAALTMLENMEHRGACGFEANTGDGAGILCQIPHSFFEKILTSKEVTLPAANEYGVGMFFFPKDSDQRKACESLIEEVCLKNNFEIIFNRKVPVNNTFIGQTALDTEPEMEQIFLKPKKKQIYFDFEQTLYFLKTKLLNRIYQEHPGLTDDFYIASLSSKTMVYKGQLMATQLRSYFLDLQNPEFKSALAIVHSRFSTNTFPKWKLAQPFRCIAHNGEINTIQGNINWWEAREQYMKKSGIYNEEWTEALPVCDPYLSDSGNFDNVVDFLIRTTRSIPHAMMMMIPEAWQNDSSMEAYKRVFYQYHDSILEPWDGPAAICFTDGTLAGATLDRNGLRPARYVVTSDDWLILGSEAGCIEIAPEKIIKKGRLEPGKMLVADLSENRIISDKELKEVICQRYPYAKWLENNSRHIDDFSAKEKEDFKIKLPVRQRQVAFGWTKEDENLILKAMMENSKEPIGSMGADIPLAVLSSIAQHISNYFKQQFAQVTNPPIDSLRENYYMSLRTTLGGSGKILKTNESEANTLILDSPLLSPQQYAGLKDGGVKFFKAATFKSTYSKGEQLEQAIDAICEEVKHAIDRKYNLIILSNEHISEWQVPIPSLMLVGALHHALINSGDRKSVSIVVNAGDVWETHHFATLLSYGADAIYPRLALETVSKLAEDQNIQPQKATYNYKSAVNKGLLKIMSKLGISTLQSYKSAQTFEAVGISSAVVDKCFKGTVTRLEGMRFEDLQRENEAKHTLAFSQNQTKHLPDTGFFQWKQSGEYHLFNPKTIHLLQYSTRLNDFSIYKKFTTHIDEAYNNASTLRSFFKIKKSAQPIPLAEVEPVENILKRFASGAMSFGSISHEAHTTLAKAMNRIGAKSNSGEGGEDEKRFKKLENGDWERSAIKQVASGRFGVTINYLANAEEIQIKMAQGAKPGEGGQLPGHKVDKNIARVRNATPGVGLISPPPHHDIYSIEDLAQLIFDLKNANRKARISVKLVSKTGVGIIASGVTKAHADHILISGHDGGTGASPLSSIRHAGLPWELGLSETHQTLVRNKLRNRVTLQCDGQMRTGRDLAVATMLGAEEWGIATAALVVEGCILMRKCHLNTCPVGIATQDPELRKKFDGKVEHLVNYFNFLAEDLRIIMSQLGIRTVNELVGRADFLEVDKSDKHWKTTNLDLEKIIAVADQSSKQVVYKTIEQDHGLENVLDHKLIEHSYSAISHGKSYHSIIPIKSTDRAVGAMLSNHLTIKYGSTGLESDTIHFDFQGSAGQSFGAFLAKGIFFNVNGETNDYFGKGLSGGKLVVSPPHTSKFLASKNLIIGNVALYGATSGTAYIQGIAGDRFAVRNSGAEAVVEGIGANGCEYMTGGKVIILGEVGKNFAAGMSGGIAYLFHPQELNKNNINSEMVLLEVPAEKDLQAIRKLIRDHYSHTGSPHALDILSNWSVTSAQFTKIIPKEYKAALERQDLTNKVIGRA